MLIEDAIVGDLPLKRAKLNPLRDTGFVRSGSKFQSALLDGLIKFGIGNDLIDQTPVFGPLALHPLFDRTKNISQIAAHFALIGDAGQTTRARQDRQ